MRKTKIKAKDNIICVILYFYFILFLVFRIENLCQHRNIQISTICYLHSRSHAYFWDPILLPISGLNNQQQKKQRKNKASSGEQLLGCGHFFFYLLYLKLDITFTCDKKYECCIHVIPLNKSDEGRPVSSLPLTVRSTCLCHVYHTKACSLYGPRRPLSLSSERDVHVRAWERVCVMKFRAKSVNRKGTPGY